MAGNLRDRLRRIRGYASAGNAVPTMPPAKAKTLGDPPQAPTDWVSVDTYVQKRTILLSLPAPPPRFLESSFAYLVPGAAELFSVAPRVDAGVLRFFDLETTGLSGGAGTIAFLAAVGTFVYGERGNSIVEHDPGRGQAALQVTQFLLLDYPGEGVFLEAFHNELESGKLPGVLVSYNGKAFDSQILKNRCLMNGFAMPSLPHIDLLPTSRALWRRVLPSCALAEVERSILGIDRPNDMPGSEAPDAWFEYLRSGRREKLDRICEHNAADLKGLAGLCGHISAVAAAPLDAARHRPMDLEPLALRWMHLQNWARKAKKSEAEIEQIGHACRELVNLAVAEDCPRVLFEKAKVLRRVESWKEAHQLLARIVTECEAASGRLKAAAGRYIALDLEWRFKNYSDAIFWIDTAMLQSDLPESLLSELALRKARLARKLKESF